MKKNTTNNTTEKNTTNNTPAPDTTNNTKEERKEKNMKTAKKNTTPTTEKKNTLPENIEQAKKTLSGDLSTLEKLLNTPAGAGEKFATLSARVNEKRGTVAKDLSALNHLLALQYYRKTPLFDIVRAGENVPAVVIDETEKAGKYTLKLKNTKVYPTLSGMKSAGVIDDEVLARVDTIRRVSAFVKSGNTARVYLTGDTENKKDCPSEKVSAMIESMGTPSKNKARALLTRVFSDLTGEKYKKEVFPKLYDEFETYITKRARKWSERNMVSKATACDMVMEFAWMYFNGMTAFKYTGD